VAPEDFNKVKHILERYKGCGAKLWRYLLSHKQLHIQLIQRDEEQQYREEGKCTDLVCYDCTRIEAQTSWKDANIDIQEMEAPNYVVVDTKNGLFVECKLIVIHQNVTKPAI
jgi:hypothetical protein